MIYTDQRDEFYSHKNPALKDDIYFDYEADEDGNMLSACCGEVIDEDVMICPRCKEHC